MRTYSAEAARALCRLQYRGMRTCGAGAASRAYGILQAHLVHYSRRREAPCERAKRVLQDLASASGIHVPPRHEAELTAFMHEYLSGLFFRGTPPS
ncbi:hypothetical protein DW352_14005 [Pseudolabrys taiwanensis]|uniref:Uncharacterized protein n=1 Tax=Pseudolabrys taiwanensis TaxID=331696 RepID=A0A345ZX82_9HYPH|nr:hypothetical protein DW352_14005 [Pseudolabrys taiwanensis]